MVQLCARDGAENFSGDCGFRVIGANSAGSSERAGCPWMQDRSPAMLEAGTFVSWRISNANLDGDAPLDTDSKYPQEVIAEGDNFAGVRLRNPLHLCRQAP